ncbi:MAG: DUF6036 family nucleotidyltransferase [Acidimicrobiales bacterium]
MRRDQLEHLIRAAGDILGVTEVTVIGSQAILGTFPTGLPEAAVRSREADLLPSDDPEGAKADLVEGALGEGSPFQESFGVYADGVGEHTARLPRGWRDRLVPVCNDNTNGVTGWCLEPHDLCVSKLLAGRPKDHDFCRALVRAGLVDPELLLDRLDQLERSTEERDRARAFVRGYARESAMDDPSEEEEEEESFY